MEGNKRFKFLEIFREHPDGSLSPTRLIDVNGVIFSPSVSFEKGVSFGGVDFHLYKYLDIDAAERHDGILKILGFYKNQ